MGESTYGVFDSEDDPDDIIAFKPSFYGLSQIMSTFGSGDFYELKFSGNFPKFSSNSDSVNFHVFSNSSVIAIIGINKGCASFRLDISLFGTFFVSDAIPASVWELNGNYAAISAIPVSGEIPDSSTIQTNHNTWSDTSWINYGNLSILEYTKSIKTSEFSLDLLGTSFLVCTIPIV